MKREEFDMFDMSSDHGENQLLRITALMQKSELIVQGSICGSTTLVK